MNTPIKPYKPSDWVIEPGTPEHDAYMAAKAGAEASKPAFVPKTAAQVKDEFKKHGISIAGWARANGYSTQLTFDILAGKRNPTRGQSHNIAVTLGLKDGHVMKSDADIFKTPV